MSRAASNKSKRLPNAVAAPRAVRASKRKPRPRLSEGIRLQLKYPDQYVALVNTAKPGKRKVLAVARTFLELHELLAKIPAAKDKTLAIEYMPDPEGPLPFHSCLVGV